MVLISVSTFIFGCIVGTIFLMMVDEIEKKCRRRSVPTRTDVVLTASEILRLSGDP